MRVAPFLIFCCLTLPVTASAAGSDKQKPYPHYWMSVSTTSQSFPGMTPEVGNIAALFGGKKMFGPRRELLLQLESPKVTGDQAQAKHAIPAGQKMGASLALATPVPDTPDYTPRESLESRDSDQPERYEKPKARLLIYWGCGDTIAKGQPKIIDTATMTPADFASAFSGRTPTSQTPPAPRKGWTYGEWPKRGERTEIPDDSSLAGAHRVTGNYTPDISFTLDQKRDFMAPVEFQPLQKSPTGALKLEWKPIPTAIGYFANAIGHNPDTEDTIFWSVSETAETGFALNTYLTPGDVSRFIKEKVVLEPARTNCVIPPVFPEGQPGMLQFIAYGEELDLVHPPKPKDTKKRWDIEWSAKVRLKSTAMMPLMAGDEGNSAASARPGRKSPKREKPDKERQEEPRPESPPEETTDSDSTPPAREIGNKLRGLFGF